MHRFGRFDLAEDAAQDALLVLCCHPVLSEASRICLTLRAVGGLTTAQIEPGGLDQRLKAALPTLHLIFHEGYTRTLGPELTSGELSSEAIRLTRLLRTLRPDDAEVNSLLVLMLLTIC